jgi:hypothetical protein
MVEGGGHGIARRVQVAAAPDGSLLYVVDFQPEATPGVQASDLMRAWGAARGAANGARFGVDRALLFRKPDGALARLSLADAEARCWAGAVDRLFGLDHVYGMAVCLRLLALVDLLARAPWLAGLYDLAGGEAELHPALLAAAATCALDSDARLVDGEVRGRLRVVASAPAPGA